MTTSKEMWLQPDGIFSKDCNYSLFSTPLYNVVTWFAVTASKQ